MDKDTIGNKIKKASNENLIKLVVEHYLTKREQGDSKGLLSASELDMAVEEANKRRIARRIDIILRADQSIAYTRFDLNTANLLFRQVVSYLENELDQYKTIAEIYSSGWLKPKSKDQQEYRDAIIKHLRPHAYIFNDIGKFKENDSNWLLALDTQIKKIKKCIVSMQKIEEWAGYPIIRGIAEEHIKESRFNIGIFLNRLEDLVYGFFYDLGVYETRLDDIIYDLAFYSLSESDQKEFNQLFPNIETEHDFLDEEEAIANLLNDKGELTPETTEKLADLIVKKAYNKYAGKYQLYHYFANIPILEVARRWAKEKGLKPTRKLNDRGAEALKAVAEKQGVSEDRAKEELFLETEVVDVMQKYAKDNNTTLEKILKGAVIDWFNEGIPYPPLVKTEHKDLFNRWVKARKEMGDKIKNLIDKGELKTTDNGKTIVRDSLYNLKGHPDIETVIDNGFYRKNKEFRDYIKQNVGLDKFTAFLDKLQNIIDTHSKLSDEEMGFFRENTRQEKKDITELVYTVKENIEAKKNNQPEKPYKEIAQSNPYSNIPLENRGLTEAEYLEIDEILKVAKGDYGQ